MSQLTAGSSKTADAATHKEALPSEAPAIAADSDPTTSNLPASTFFDGFNYQSAADPQLLAHGWEPRQGQGGPGIENSWSTSAVTFPKVASAQGGKAMQLQVTTDGTKTGTHQAQVDGIGHTFFTGTLAARVYFSAAPAIGRDGDHINEAVFLMSPQGAQSPKYSELDYEYMPNGGWGAPGPRMDTTTWRSAKDGDRLTHSTLQNFHGWHTLMLTAMNGTVTYSIDGQVLFTNNGDFVREPTGIQFSAWLIDLPFTGSRTWNMQVNWIYVKDGQAVSLKDVHSAVDTFYAQNVSYVDTMP